MQLAASTPTQERRHALHGGPCVFPGHHVLFHVLFHGLTTMYFSYVLFHMLLQCRLLSPRLRAHLRSKLARLCPVHLCNTRSREGVSDKGLLHKPVPPLAKTRWYLRLIVFALESHYQQVCSTQTGVPPEQCCCWFSCLLTSEWHSVNMSIYSNPAQGRSARFGSAWSGGEVELVILTNSGW